jgi:hypothetical protein
VTPPTRRRPEARDVPHRDSQIAFFYGDTFDSRQQPLAFHEHSLRTIHHDLGHVGIHDQVLERPEERQDQFEAHDAAPIVR